ncbi:MAG TPA: DUF3667 domain-containing protein [Aquimonas sp.]|nr:DUF3667 domain-containing protein [Aquimonas sp.]HRF55369.1 DUF3667 domain-containing protein [Aquimonas sp.]
MSDESTTLAIRHCENCGTPLQGEHCYACGQPTKGLVRHFPSILGDFVDTVFDIDGRIWRTLWPLLFRPGHLTLEYLRGHRVRFVSPVRLFVFLSVLAFLAMQWSIHWDEDTITFDPPDQFASAATEAELEAQRSAALSALNDAQHKLDALPGGVDLAAATTAIENAAQARRAQLHAGNSDTEASSTPHIAFNDRPWHPTDNPLQIDALPEVVNQKLNDWAGQAEGNIARIRQHPALLGQAFINSLPQTLFVLVPVFALLLKVLYLLKRRLYMEHLIMALHSHAFVSLVLLLTASLSLSSDTLQWAAFTSLAEWLSWLLWLWVPIYLFVTLKRVYRQGWIMTTLKSMVLSTCYLVLLSLGATFNLAVNLVTL